MTLTAPTPVVRAATRPLSFAALSILTALTAIAPLSIDMYLPGFPAMVTELGATSSAIQLTMTTFLLGMAIGQLVIGPLSDALGRRLPLIAGSVLCLAATVVCAVAPDATLLAVARFAAGFGGAAGIVLARAMISDTAEGPAVARLLGVLSVIGVIAPVIAPLAGGAMTTGGWRAVFWVLAALLAVLLVGVLIWGRETLPRERRTRGGLKAVFASAGEVLRNRAYVGYVLVFGFSFAALFAYISASPFVIQTMLGFDAGTYSLLFALNAVAITATSAAAAALAGKVELRRMIGIGLTVAVVAAFVLLLLALSGVPTLPTLIAFGVLQASMGFIFGNATTLAVGQAAEHAGTASAFLGFLQFILAAATAPVVGLAGEASAVPMGIAMVVAMIVAVWAFGFAKRPRTR